MQFLSILAPLALATTAVALPGWGDWHGHGPKCPESTCLTQADAETVVDSFIAIIDHPDVAAANASAQKYLADSFFEKSDSINLLAGYPVSSSRAKNTPRTSFG